MKKILILTLLIPMLAKSQTPQTIYGVSTMQNMKTYNGMANRIHVSATNEDYILCSPCTVDNISVFSGTAGKTWKRFMDRMTVTNIGTSGPATWNGSVLNIPNYTSGGNTVTPNLAWGSFSGNISNQSDLMAALNIRLLKTDTAAMLQAYLASINAHTAQLSALTSQISTLTSSLTGKQATLVSSTNIKTINGISLLGSGDIVITSGTGSSAWTAITGKPTTVTGYGITDAFTKTQADGLYAGLNNPNFSGTVKNGTDTLASKAYVRAFSGGSGGGSAILYGSTGGNTDGAMNQAAVTNALATKQPLITAGTTLQYLRGDLSLATFPTVPTNTNQLTNGSGFITGLTFAQVTSKPTTIAGYGITDAATSTDIAGRVPVSRTVNGKALSADISITATDVGLGSVNNTPDASKPVSTAQAAAIATKLAIPDTANIRLRAIAGTNMTITGTYPNLTFNASGTGGTGDVTTTGTQTLTNKTLTSPVITGTPTAPTQSTSDNSTKLATTQYVQAVAASISATAGQTQVITARSLGLTGIGDETAKLKSAFIASIGKKLLFENMVVNIYGSINYRGGEVVTLDAAGGKVNWVFENASIKITMTDPHRDSVASKGVVIRNASEAVIVGMELDCTGVKGDPSFGMSAFWIEGSSNVNINRSYIHDNGHAGFRIISCNNIILTALHTKLGDSGIFINGPGGNVTVTDCIVEGGTSEGIGIFNSSSVNGSPSSTRWVISGNIITDKTGSYGINCSNATLGVVSDNIITGCLGAMFFYDPGTSGSGIAYNIHSVNIDVHDNMMADCTFGGINNVGPGFHLHHNTYIRMFTCISTAGYSLSEGVPDNARYGPMMIDHEIIRDCQLGASVPNALITLTNITDVIFESNQILNSSNSWPGVYINNVDRMDFRNNQMYNTSLTLEAGTDFNGTTNYFTGNHLKDFQIFTSTGHGSKASIPSSHGAWVLNPNP